MEIAHRRDVRLDVILAVVAYKNEDGIVEPVRFCCLFEEMLQRPVGVFHHRVLVVFKMTLERFRDDIRLMVAHRHDGAEKRLLAAVEGVRSVLQQIVVAHAPVRFLGFRVVIGVGIDAVDVVFAQKHVEFLPGGIVREEEHRMIAVVFQRLRHTVIRLHRLGLHGVELICRVVVEGVGIAAQRREDAADGMFSGREAVLEVQTLVDETV